MAILYFSGAETGQIVRGGTGEDHWGFDLLPEPYESQALRVVTNPVRAGNRAIRLYWESGWPAYGSASDKIRSELANPGRVQLLPGNEYWLGISVFMHDNAVMRSIAASTRINAHAWQYHFIDDPGTSGMNMREGRWIFSFGTKPERDCGPIELGRWTDFVIHCNTTRDSTGFVRMWRDAASDAETPVYEFLNQSVCPLFGLNCKIGIYRGGRDNIVNGISYLDPGQDYCEQFYDEFRIGDANESFASVKPRGSTNSGTNHTPVPVEAASEVSSPSITQTHVILADDVEATSETQAALLNNIGIQDLFADDIQAQAEVSVPVLFQNVVETNITPVNVWFAGGDAVQLRTRTINPVGATAGNLLVFAASVRNGGSMTLGTLDRQGVLFFSGGETGAIQPVSSAEDGWNYDVIETEPYFSEAIQVVSSVPGGAPYAGTKAIRLYYEKGWPGYGVNELQKTELKLPGGNYLLFGETYWIGMAIYIEDNQNNRDLVAVDWLINCRWVSFHDVGGDAGPGFHIRGGRWECAMGSGANYTEEVDVGAVVLGGWNVFVIQCKPAQDATGFAKIWFNPAASTDTPQYSKTGAWAYELNPRIGCYRGASDGTGTPGNGGWGDATYFEAYYDEYRIGTEALGAGFDDVNPARSVSPETGWTQHEIYHQDGTTARVGAALWTRIATGDEQDAATLSWQDLRRSILGIAEYSGFIANPVEDTGFAVPGTLDATYTSLSTGSATATAPNGAYIAVAALYNRATGTTLAAGTVDYEHSYLADTAVPGINFGHYDYSTAGSKSETWTLPAGNNGVGFILTGQTYLSQTLFANDVEAQAEVSTPSLTSSGAIRIYPDADDSVGSWTNELGSGTNLYQSIDETAENDADYIQSELNPSSSTARIRLSNPLLTPSATDTHTVSYRYKKGNGSSDQVDLTVKLVQGASTVIATWSHTNISATIAEVSQTLTAPQIATISDYDDLYLEFTANAV